MSNNTGSAQGPTKVGLGASESRERDAPSRAEKQPTRPVSPKEVERDQNSDDGIRREDKAHSAELRNKPRRISKSEVKTGGDLTRYRHEYSLSDDQVAWAINRKSGCVKRWQAHPEKPLNIDIIESFVRNFDDEGIPVGGWNRPDALRENFMDEDDKTKRELLYALKMSFNEKALNPQRGLDRIVLTGIPEIAVPVFGAGAIYMANDKAREGNQVGDWATRDIVTSFHVTPPTQRTYPFQDGKWWVVAQNVSDADAEDSGLCLIAVSSDLQLDSNIFMTLNALRKETKKYVEEMKKYMASKDKR